MFFACKFACMRASEAELQTAMSCDVGAGN